MRTLKPFFFTTVGLKYLMGLSGLVWTGFVLAHMIGNMLIFVGPDAYNLYGHYLTSGYIIYIAEAALILALATHVGIGIWLTITNRAARGDQRYAAKPNGLKAASLQSRTMAFHGTMILIFLVLHISSFKFGTYYETTIGGQTVRDLHRLIIEIFRQPSYVVWYVFCLILLASHLSHGVGSVFQSFGFRNEHYARTIKIVSYGYAAIVAGGFLSQPLYVYFFAK